MKILQLINAIALLFLFGLLNGQDSGYDPDRQLPVTQLQEDFDILRECLQTVHPSLYNYRSKAEMTEIFDKMSAQIEAPMTELEFYRLTGVLLRAIGDAHTDMEASKACYEALDKEWKLFPFQVKWIEGALYITHNFSSEENIERGSRIRTINGRDIEPIFKKLRAYMPRDGYNIHGPNRALSRLFMDFYYFMIERPDSFQLELERLDGTSQEAEVGALTLPQIESFIRKRYPGPKTSSSPKDRSLLRLEIKDETATLTLKSFHAGRIKEGGQHFAKFFKQAFQQINEAGVDYLILDLRNNGGGSGAVIGRLATYLLDRPFRLYKEQSLATNTIPHPQHFRANVKALERRVRKKLRRQGDRFILQGEEDLQIYQPSKDRYAGRLFILINEGSGSATGDLAGVLRQHQRAIFVGQEVSGNSVCSSGGETLPLVLPNSKVKVLIPTVRFLMDVDFGNEGHGVIPDHVVVPSIDDYLQNRDPEMVMVQKLISKEMEVVTR